MKDPLNSVPKTIWFMWLQGLDNAPLLVKKCYASWKKRNPNWNLVFLCEDNINEYIDLRSLGIRSESIIKQAFSDLVRINLLAQHGGVWVDATCYCQISLDTWLGEYTKSGFFAFYKPAKDRWIASWFLVSAPGCYLVLKWRDESNDYWRNNHFSSNRSRWINLCDIDGDWRRHTFSSGIIHLVSKKLHILINRDTGATKIWFSYFVRKILKVYPYFWFHYLFNQVINKDEKCMKIWLETKQYSAHAPHKLLFYGLLKPLSEEIKHHIDSKRSPAYKLTWKYSDREYKEGCTLHYLLESTVTERPER